MLLEICSQNELYVFVGTASEYATGVAPEFFIIVLLEKVLTLFFFLQIFFSSPLSVSLLLDFFYLLSSNTFCLFAPIYSFPINQDEATCLVELPSPRLCFFPPYNIPFFASP